MMTAKALPDDGTGATLKRYDNTRETRYAEVILIGGDPAMMNLQGNVYNTYGLNDTERTGDSSPDAVLAMIDLDALKAVWRPRRLPERPRLWALGWIEVPSGARRDFNGLQAAWVGKADLSGVNLQQKGGTAYKPTTIERKTEFGFSTASRSSSSTTRRASPGSLICRSHRGSRPEVDQLKGFGGRLKPALGWKFRVQVLEEDLILRPGSGVAGIVQDELGNTYDLAGPGYSNYKP